MARNHKDPSVVPPSAVVAEEEEEKEEPSLSFWTTEGERLRKAFIQAFQSKPESKPSSSLPTFSYCDGDDDYGGPMYSDYQTDLTELLKIDKNPLVKDTANDGHRCFSRALNVVQSATQILAEKRNPSPADAKKFLIAKELDFVVAAIKVLVVTTAIAAEGGGGEGGRARSSATHNTEENVTVFFDRYSWMISGCFMEFRLKSSRCRQSTLCRKAIATMERQLVKLGEAILTGFPPRPVGNDEGEKKKGGDAKPPPPAATAAAASRYFLTKSAAKELTVFLGGFFDSVCGMYHLPSAKVDPVQLKEDREREAKYALLAMQIYECASSAFPSRFESYPFYSCHAPLREAAIRLVKERCAQVPATQQESIPLYQLTEGEAAANHKDSRSRRAPPRRHRTGEERTVPLLLFGAQLARTFTDSDGRFWAGCSKTQFEVEDLALWKFGFYRLAVEMSTRPLPVEAARQRQEKKDREKKEREEQKKRLKEKVEKEKTSLPDDDEDEEEDEKPKEVYLGPTRYRCQPNHALFEEWSMLLHEKQYLTDTAFRSHSKNRWGTRKDDESRYMQFDVWKRYQYLRHYASVERYFLNVKLMLASGVCRIDPGDGGNGEEGNTLGSPSGTLRGLTFDVRNEIISFVLGEFSMPKDFLRKRFKFPPPQSQSKHHHSTPA